VTLQNFCIELNCLFDKILTACTLTSDMMKQPKMSANKRAGTNVYSSVKEFARLANSTHGWPPLNRVRAIKCFLVVGLN
jgi:hypothetical protein